MSIKSCLSLIVLWCAVCVSGLAQAAAYGNAKDPSQIVGSKKCAKCHKEEFKVLKGTPHFTSFRGAESISSHPDTPKIANAMGVDPKKAVREQPCAGCHSTVGFRKGKPKPMAIEGVSCESCHGPAKPWLELHQDFGLDADGDPISYRSEESEEHRKKRHAMLEEKGMILPHDVYGFAENCFGCHLVPNEKLVQSGHHPGRAFHLVERQKEIHHGAPLTDNIKKKMVILGYSVELEKALLALSKTRIKDGALATQLVKRSKITGANLVVLTNGASQPQLVAIKGTLDEVASLLGSVNSAAAKQGLQKVSKKLTKTNEALSKGTGKDLPASFLSHQHKDSGDGFVVLKNPVPPIPDLVTVPDPVPPILDPVPVPDPVPPVPNPVPVPDPVKPEPVVSLDHTFDFIVPKSHKLCQTNNPWAMGVSRLNNTATLRSGECHGLRLKLAQDSVIFLFHLTQSGQLMELASDQCDLLGVGTDPLQAGKEYLLPRNQRGEHYAMVLDNKPGKEWFNLLVTDRAAAAQIRATFPRPSSCGELYKAGNSAFNDLDKTFKELGAKEGIQLIQRAIVYE